MKITKLGHCCLLIEKQGLRLLTDPGIYSDAQDSVTAISAVLITHEHQDHLHAESLQKVLANNPGCEIYANNSVRKILQGLGITSAKLIADGETVSIINKKVTMTVKGIGKLHELVYPGLAIAENTGLLFDGSFFYPGDAFTIPQGTVEFLALPVAGPWLTLAQAIDYALAIKPRLAFPVHDGMLRHIGPVHSLPEKILKEHGLLFKPLLAGETLELD